MNEATDRTINEGVSQYHRPYSGMPITETITNGFFTVDQKWTVLSWNKAAEMLLHKSSEFMIGKNIWEEFVDLVPLNFYVVYQQAFLNDIPVHFLEYWSEMGAWFDVITYNESGTLSVSFKNASGLPTTDKSGGPARQLKILNELYRYITEVTNDCLWEWDLLDKQIFWIDGSHKRIFGYAIENALVPQYFWESRIHPDDKPKVLNQLNKMLSSARTTEWEVEYRFMRANGQYAYVCDRGHLMFDNADKPVRMIGATEDITQRKLTEAKLLASEQKLALIAKQMVNAVVTTDPAGNITWVNAAFTNITEYRSEEVIGKKPGSLLQGPGTDPATVEYLKRKIRAVKPFDCDILNYSKSGRPFWMHLHGQPLFDEKGRLERYFAMETDITEKVEMEKNRLQELELKQEQIAQAVLAAQELERTTIGREMHDNLNQILGAAKLYVELARSEEFDRDLCLDKASGYIVNVIQHIRKISKALVTPVLVIGLTDSINILVDDMQAGSELIINFIHDVDENKLSEALQFDLFRIVQEQLNNILKHATAKHVTIMLTRNDTELTLQISDDGKGTNLAEPIKGVGILNIKTRAKIHNGTVSMYSAAGEGFRLQLVVPLPE